MDFLETSAKNRINIQEAFDQITMKIFDRVFPNADE
jgi:hypothetical protein